MSWQGGICDFYSEGQPSSSDLSMRTQRMPDVPPPNLNLVFEANKHRTSISSSSGSSVCEPLSPSTPIQPQPSISICPVSEPEEDAGDEPWNLVAYHVPWGPGYEGYEAGTLPGPDGTCIFLRSPTPLKRQRTSQACDKCRERKAKCSGAKPTCGRCFERGFLCVYSPSQVPAVAGAEGPNSPTKLHRKLSYSSSREQLKISIKNRIRRKSSQTETIASASFYNKTHPAFPRRHSQPASAAHAPAPVSVTPIVSMFQEQLRMEEDQAIINNASTSGEDRADSQELSNIISTGSPDYDLQSQQSLNLYAQSITALEAYRFPPLAIENAPTPLVTCPPDVNVRVNFTPAIYHVDNGLSMQLPPPDILWQVPEYYQQLDLKTHGPPLSVESFQHAFVNSNSVGMPPQQHINATGSNSSLEQEQQIVYLPYFQGYETNFQP